MLLALLLVFPFVAANFGNSWVRIMDFALLYTMLALGLNIVVGFAGLLDLGYVAFYATGAYLTALLASPQFALTLESLTERFPAAGAVLLNWFGSEVAQNGLHLPVWVVVPLCAVAAGALGALLGAPTLKLRGDYLAMVTLGFGEVIRLLIVGLNRPIDVTGGSDGVNMIDPVSVFGMSLHGEAGAHGNLQFGSYSMPSVNAYYFLFLALCIAIIFVTSRLHRSRLGRAFIAIREDEMAAKAMGINARNVKLLAFTMGASFGGVAGSMFASFQGYISPESFSLSESITILAMVILGGTGHVPGVILGAVLLAVLPEILRHLVEPIQLAAFGEILVPAEILRVTMVGAAMMMVMLTRPAGLWPKPAHEA
jgi:branched-chain amino acid transport system permease protein